MTSVTRIRVKTAFEKKRVFVLVTPLGRDRFYLDQELTDEKEKELRQAQIDLFYRRLLESKSEITNSQLRYIRAFFDSKIP